MRGRGADGHAARGRIEKPPHRVRCAVQGDLRTGRAGHVQIAIAPEILRRCRADADIAGAADRDAVDAIVQKLVRRRRAGIILHRPRTADPHRCRPGAGNPEPPGARLDVQLVDGIDADADIAPGRDADALGSARRKRDDICGGTIKARVGIARERHRRLGGTSVDTGEGRARKHPSTGSAIVFRPGAKSTRAPPSDDAAIAARTRRPAESRWPVPTSHWSGCATPAIV